MKKALPKYFSEYKKEANNWITLANGEYYPDILKDACELYKPVLVLFGQLDFFWKLSIFQKFG